MLSLDNLHPYQRRVLELAKTTTNLGLLMAPGLGKSVTSLTILSQSKPGRTLIVAPKQVAESVWSQECSKWEHLKDLYVVKIMGSPRERLYALHEDADVYVVNNENLAWLVDNWVPGKFDYLVIDESSRYKDPSTKRFKALKKVLREFKRRIIATGTPTPQGLGDLWSQVAILDLGERLGKTLTGFRENYMFAAERNRHTGVVYKWAVREGKDKEIMDKISDICVSLSAKDYLTLPPLAEVYQPVVLPLEVQAQYKQLKKSMVVEIDGVEITAVSAAALANKLLQAASGALYDEDKNVVVAHDAKLEALESILEQAGGPVLVFYHYKSSLSRIATRFPQAVSMDPGVLDDWRAGKVPLMLAHPQSGGIGVNLQCNAHEMAHVVWFDLPWSSESYVQANARVYRQGQEKPVMLHHLVASGTIDQQVVDVLQGKINLQQAVLDTLKMEQA
jgi:SNF2 family DNA or RNA helicase